MKRENIVSYFEQITEPLLMQSYATLFFVSFVMCLVIILSSSYGFTRRAADEAAIQSGLRFCAKSWRVGGLYVF